MYITTVGSKDNGPTGDEPASVKASDKRTHDQTQQPAGEEAAHCMVDKPRGETPTTDRCKDKGAKRYSGDESREAEPAIQAAPPRDEVPEEVHLDPIKTLINVIPNIPYVQLSLTFFALMLLFQVVLFCFDCYNGFQIESNHSKCTSDWFPFLLTTSLRALSRIAFPLAIFTCFCIEFLKEQSENCSSRRKFIMEVVKPRNQYIADEFINSFLNYSNSQNEVELKERIRYIQQYLDKYLWKLVLLSLIQACVLITALAVFSAFNLSQKWFVIFILDLVSFGVLLFMCGVAMSLLLLDGEIKHYIRQFRTFCTSKLKQKAKTVDDCIGERWHPMNKLISAMTVLYCFLLVISWASGSPLSCGYSINNQAIKDESACGYWLVFIMVLALGQFFGTNPKSFTFAVIIIGIEVLVLLVVGILSPTLEWSKFTHILYAIVPLSYLLWYHIMSIPRQWAGITLKTKTKSTAVNSRTIYWSRIGSRSAMIALIAFSLIASVYTEYKHITPSAIGQYSKIYVSLNVDPSPPPEYDEATMKLILEYNQKYCSIHPSTKQLDSSIPCLHLNPDLFEDKETRNLIAKSISMVQTLWSVHQCGNTKLVLAKQPHKVEPAQ